MKALVRMGRTRSIGQPSEKPSLKKVANALKLFPTASWAGNSNREELVAEPTIGIPPSARHRPPSHSKLGGHSSRTTESDSSSRTTTSYSSTNSDRSSGTSDSDSSIRTTNSARSSDSADNDSSIRTTESASSRDTMDSSRSTEGTPEQLSEAQQILFERPDPDQWFQPLAGTKGKQRAIPHEGFEGTAEQRYEEALTKKDTEILVHCLTVNTNNESGISGGQQSLTINVLIQAFSDSTHAPALDLNHGGRQVVRLPSDLDAERGFDTLYGHSAPDPKKGKRATDQLFKRPGGISSHAFKLLRGKAVLNLASGTKEKGLGLESSETKVVEKKKWSGHRDKKRTLQQRFDLVKGSREPKGNTGSLFFLKGDRSKGFNCWASGINSVAVGAEVKRNMITSQVHSMFGAYGKRSATGQDKGSMISKYIPNYIGVLGKNNIDLSKNQLLDIKEVSTYLNTSPSNSSPEKETFFSVRKLFLENILKEPKKEVRTRLIHIMSVTIKGQKSKKGLFAEAFLDRLRKGSQHNRTSKS